MSEPDRKRPRAATRRKKTRVRAKVVALGLAKKEARKFCNAGQYEHLTDVVKRLVDFNDPAEMSDMRIEPIDGIYELKEKGGLLGKINARVYFNYYPDTNEVVVAKADKKEEDGQAKRHIIINAQTRLRQYRRGELREGISVYEAGTYD